VINSSIIAAEQPILYPMTAIAMGTISESKRDVFFSEKYLTPFKTCSSFSEKAPTRAQFVREIDAASR
jgi:hypothetical protein